jgi:hypothetical protein
MLALPVKYLPVSRRRLDLLRLKLAACRRLLAGLVSPAIRRTSTEILP